MVAARLDRAVAAARRGGRSLRRSRRLVEPEVLPVQGRVHVLVANGANVVVQAGEQGAFVVDTGNGTGTETRADRRCGRLTSAPIRYLVNTSADADHLGGNAALSAAGSTSPRRTRRATPASRSWPPPSWRGKKC